MDPQSPVIIFRMIERIIGVGLGGLLIYLGYRLFLDVRGKREASGDFSVGANKVKLSKVGPGVFFALFGAGLILFSLLRPVSITTSGGTAPGGDSSSKGTTPAEVKFMGVASVPATDAEREQRRAETRKRIIALNKAPAQLAPSVSRQDRTDLELATDIAKQALMEPLWAEDWGDLADFRDWIEKRGPVPKGAATAVEFFQQK